jgi:hypothetical protein
VAIKISTPDMIEAWLEESLFRKFPLNGKYIIQSVVKRDINDLILSIAHRPVFQFLMLTLVYLFSCRIRIPSIVTLNL